MEILKEDGFRKLIKSGLSGGYLFFGEEADSVVINPVLYPDRSVIERCTMMHDSGARTEALLEMWSRVKGDNLNNWMVIVILLSFVVLLIVGVMRKLKQRRQRCRRW